ncbi:MAG TPA: AAA family ATPase [Syntrophorhabdales bacterium]|nr:AAA family ATPase [Syntrophorhabdales bacterium]
MYLAFYRFEKQPFHVTPDPEFLYLSPSHEKALAAITRGVEERRGFIAITGDVGVGKTTILRSYLQLRRKEPLKTVYVFNALLSFEGLLKTIYRDLGLRIAGSSVTEMVDRLHEVLLEESKQGNTVVLFIDEAQNMPADTLESLVAMSDGETSKDKLLQIVLMGQPEFKKALNTNGLRHLGQRLTALATIRPLSRAESLEYLRFRLKHAGADPTSVFTASALKKIARKSKGIPRVLNILCDNALITGFGRQEKPVTKAIVQEIIRSFQGRSDFVRRQLPLAALAPVQFALGLTSFLGIKRVLSTEQRAPVYREQGEQDEAIGE